jgi:hypothetical protein
MARTQIIEPPDYSQVPDVPRDAELDPHWQKLTSALLPAFYMPGTMNGKRSLPMRIIATVVIGVFMFATTLGYCLTYGAPS